MSSLIHDLRARVLDNTNALALLGGMETPAAYLTLTRTATLAITTAGTQITWQSETRNQAFTWSGTTITVPSAGYYSIFVSIALAANTAITIRTVINSVNRHMCYIAAPFSTSNGYEATAAFGYYAQENDSIVISLTPAANTTLNQNAENAAAPSPFVHIVQMTASDN